MRDAAGVIVSVRERPVNIAMPKINAASELISAAAALTDAVALGQVTPGEAALLSTLVGNVAKAVETFELSERLAKLERSGFVIMRWPIPVGGR
jgi:hypothetical protein